MKKIAFFLGKGGVGKTTISSSVAYQMSRSGTKVLIVSLDPAHNLGDVFQTKLTNEKRPLDTNLDGMEIDLSAWVARYLDESRKEIKANYAYHSAINVDSYINILKYSPGTEEYAVLWAIEHIYHEYAPVRDLIIFDTPPTALTLRFLAMPSITSLWVRELSAMREKILKKRQTILAINPDAGIVKKSSPAQTDASEETPVQGAMDKKDDQIYIKLSGIGKRLAELQRLFSHESYLSVVVNPDTLSLAEALRIREELGRLGVHINSVCLNKTSPEGAGRENVEKNFGNCPVFMSRLLAEGLAAVSDLGAIDVEGVKNDMKAAR
ncbi:MAG: ArsA family ATPase [Spirochaetales bacterium]|jgi:arsenite-transporting ATPase|nr:ArsA family ATPase [Spirochaetales bacterium]